MNFALPTILHDWNGFAALARLHSQTEHCFLDNVEIDMKATDWFDADMCAPFGAILYRLGAELNSVHLVDIDPSVEKILSQNGFLSYYGREQIPDYWKTTVTYQRFDVEDDKYFSKYIENEFIRRYEIPKMSSRLMKKFHESIFEIFSNAVLHSHTKLGIFSCGQFFPKNNCLDFTVADLGVGVRKRVCDYLGNNLSPAEAISWAAAKNNTTKQGPIPGGLGLSLLCDFIDLNGGCIQIVSDAGYWRRKNKRTYASSLHQPFPGTVVNVEINTADPSSYILSSELADNEIF